MASEKMDHLLTKNEAARTWRQKGYSVEKEKTVDGMRIDVVAENENERIAIEIGSLNGEDRMERLQRNFDKVIHSTLDRDKVRKQKRKKRILVGEELHRVLKVMKADQGYRTFEDLVYSLVDESGFDVPDDMEEEMVEEQNKKRFSPPSCDCYDVNGLPVREQDVSAFKAYQRLMGFDTIQDAMHDIRRKIVDEVDASGK